MFDKVHVTVFLVNFVIFTGFINGFNVERKNDRFRRSPASEDAVEVIHKPKHYEEIVQEEKTKQGAMGEDEVEELQSTDNGRGITTNLTLRWNYEMVIVIDDSYSDGDREIIESAIFTLFTTMKCFEFKVEKKGSVVTDSKDHVYISNAGERCFSSLGRQMGRQIVSLGSGCHLYGTTIHEIMHALGFFHEHTRPDRDDYVNIDYIKLNSLEGQKGKNMKRQYEKQKDQLVFSTKYDYDSLMHYPDNPIVKAKQYKVPPGVKVGQRNHLSEGDIIRLQHAYDCSKKGT